MATSKDPHSYGRAVLGRAESAMVDSLVACEVAHLWLALTDLFESWPDHEEQAPVLIRRAASKSVTPGSNEELAAYFDRRGVELEATFTSRGVLAAHSASDAAASLRRAAAVATA